MEERLEGDKYEVYLDAPLLA
ncbi:uncharacterized protein G2W53_005034 [Senna tora]|uniref:Uncharacterized protein n=1 Tax=Senna tora TaxID=362788 RepID=A0A834XEX2_9FABA|nr:uncharacterized protein G2W53_005034 [Senna tora]